MIKFILLAFLLPKMAIGQKVAENRVDDFMHKKIVRTSWEWLDSPLGTGYGTHARTSRIGDNIWLDIKIMRFGGQISSMTEGLELMLKLDNDSVLIFKAPQDYLSCRGCGSVGINGSGLIGLNTSFLLDDNSIACLSDHQVMKIRLYTVTGYVETEVKAKNVEIIRNEIRLVFHQDRELMEKP